MAYDPFENYRDTQRSKSTSYSHGAFETQGGNTSRPESFSTTGSEQSGINAGAYAQDLRQQRFNAIFPWLQGQIGNFGSNFATAGGQSPKSPEINVGGVWNPQQIQQRVNAARSQNDQAMRTMQRGQQEQLGGQGFGANSPLLAALQGQTAASNLATNTANEREVRNTAAEQNAKHVLGTQSAREAQFASRQQEDIERRKPYFALYGSLINSLSGLAG